MTSEHRRELLLERGTAIATAFLISLQAQNSIPAIAATASSANEKSARPARDAHPSSDQDIERHKKQYQDGAHDYARSLMLKGRKLKLAGKLEQSFASYREAVEVLKNVYPRGHAFISHALDEYIDLVQTLVEKRVKARDKGQNKEGDEHLLRTLADALMLNNKYFKAKQTLLNLKTLLAGRDKEQQLRYGECLEDLTDCCIMLGKHEEAIKHETESLRLYSELVKDHDSAARCLVTLSRLYTEADQLSTAAATLTEAEELTAAVHGKHSKPYGLYLAARALYLVKSNQKVPGQLLAAIADIYDLADDEEGEKMLRTGDSQAVIRIVEMLDDDRKHEYLWHDWHKWDKDRVF